MNFDFKRKIMKKILNSYLITLFCFLLLSACSKDEETVVILNGEDPVVTVENVTPLVGYAGAEFTITGTEFGMMKDAIEVRVGDNPVEVVSCEDNSIVAKIVEGTTSGKVSVDVFGQTVNTDFVFDVLGQPGITGISSVYGFPEDEIVFTGHDLGISKSAYKVLFTGTEESAEFVGNAENEKFTVKVPENAQSGKIEVEISGIQVNVPLTNGFTVLKHATVSGLVASEGYSGGIISVKGTELKPTLLEEVEVQPMKVLLVQGDKTISAEVDGTQTTNELVVAKLPEDIQPGDYVVMVSTSFEEVATDAPLAFKVKEKPVVKSLSASEAYNGDELVFNCEHIDGVTAENVEVLFGEIKADDVFVAGNQITVKVPSLLEAGKYSIALKINGADIALGGSAEFTVLPTPKITAIDVKNFLHNETVALVKTGDELVITGENFGTEANGVTVQIGGQTAIISSITNSEIKFTVPQGFSEGKISMTFTGIDVPIEYTGINFKSLSPNDDISEYVLKNYKAPFIPDGDDMQRGGEWMKPLDWVVENGATDVMTGFAVQLTPKGDKTAGKVLALQTDWGFPKKMTDGKVYQKVALVPGRYKLSGAVTQTVISGNAYLAVAGGGDFAVTTNAIGSTALASVAIPVNVAQDSSQSIDVEFNVTEAKDYSIGFVATLNAAQKYVKFQNFTLTYLGEE